MAIEDTIRQVVGKGVSVVTDTVNNVASSAKGKADEIGRNVRRGELYKALGEKVYFLVQQGLQLPEECGELVQELNQLAEADKKEQPAAKTWGIQPSEPVPVLEVKKKTPQPAPSLQMPVRPAAPAPEPKQDPYDIKSRVMPTLKVDEVYTSAEDPE